MDILQVMTHADVGKKVGETCPGASALAFIAKLGMHPSI